MRARSAFANWSREEFLALAAQSGSRTEFLAKLGYKKRANLGLEKLMARESLAVDAVWPDRFANDRRRPQPCHQLDLLLPAHAYFYGLCLADGHLRVSRQGDKHLVGIELSERDEAILHALHDTLPWKSSVTRRRRVSPFDGGTHSTSVLTLCSRDLGRQLMRLGIPSGKKSTLVAAPTTPYHAQAFWRGVVDGDGSVGFANGVPFISLATSSERLANDYKRFLLGTTGRAPTTSVNARDGIWNVMVVRQRARALAAALYQDGALSIERKRAAALLMNHKD